MSKRTGGICGHFASYHNERRQNYYVMDTSMNDRIIVMYLGKIISAHGWMQNPNDLTCRVTQEKHSIDLFDRPNHSRLEERISIQPFLPLHKVFCHKHSTEWRVGLYAKYITFLSKLSFFHYFELL